MAELMEAGLRALLIAVVVGAGMSLLRMRNVVAQKAVWSLVLGAAVTTPLMMRWQILPASISFRLPAPDWMSKPSAANLAAASPRRDAGITFEPQQASKSANAKPRGDRFPAPTISDVAFDSAAVREGEGAPVASLPSQSTSKFKGPLKWLAGGGSLAPRTVVGLVYATVLTILAVRLFLGIAITLRLWITALPAQLAPNSQFDSFQGLPLRASAAVASPITVGSGVLLPMDYANWDAEKLRIVLAHERSHVRQGDFYLQALASLYAAVFWFSPLGWWLKRKLCDLGEAIGDRAGLEEAGSRTSYAQVLLEFAALPRPTALGVAMARTSNLAKRIERFLNEASFRQAFAGSSRRVLAAVLLVPIALFAATALIRVEAAQSTQTAVQAPTPVAPASLAAPADLSGSASVIPAEAAPAPQAAAAPPPAAARYGEVQDAADERAEVQSASEADKAAAEAHEVAESMKANERGPSNGRGYSYSYSSDGNSYALVTSPGQITFSGDWNDSTHATVEKARGLAHGKFLWFTHDGKSYFIDDSSLVSQLEAMQKPINELGRQQEILGEKEEALGRQQEELGRKQETASIPTPDISKEMAKLNEAMAKLNAKKGSTVTQEELADLQGKLGDLQGRLGELEGEVGAKQGQFGEMQGKLGEQQGRLGEEQGRLGEQQGRLAEELDRKVKSMIDQSLRDGKAKPIK